LLQGAGLPHDGPTVQRLSLARRLPGRSIRQQILYREWAGMSSVGVQGMDQCPSFQDDPDPRVATAVDATLVTLRQAEPTLQVQIFADLLERPRADEQAGQEARHHHGHLSVDRVIDPFEASDQAFERLAPLGGTGLSGVEGRGDLLDVLDVAADRFLVGPDRVEAAVDATGQSVELLLGEPPFCSSTSRRIDSRTSLNASAIRTPGGRIGPPWSSLRMPRTAAQ
jgi:hypothetical protein